MNPNDQSTPTVPPVRIDGPAAWYGADMARQSDWLHLLGPDDIEEIDTAIRHFQNSGLPLAGINPASFPLPRLHKRLAGISDDILHRHGFALLRGFPVHSYNMEEKAIGYLGIGAHLGSFRSQNARGHLLGHVRDLGMDIRKPTTRYYQTNKQLEYHTDSCDIVGLLCINGARSGGESRIISSVTLYNEMMAHRPELAAELFHPFPTDRRGEIPDGMKPWFDIPVFNWHAGYLTTIYVGQYIRSAQVNCPEARRLTALEMEAIDCLDRLTNDPALHLQMEFRPGDMQFLHNHQIMHSRTDFEDWPNPERRRHLLRLWLAPANGRPLPDCFVPRYGSVEPGNRGGIIVKDTQLTLALEPA